MSGFLGVLGEIKGGVGAGSRVYRGFRFLGGIQGLAV